jgi:hypothetical protein
MPLTTPKLSKMEGRQLMRRTLDSAQIRRVIEEALSVAVQKVRIPGIADAEIRHMALTAVQLEHLAAQLERQSYGEVSISVEMELFLRVSNTDLLSAIERADFVVRVDVAGSTSSATVSGEKDWTKAWERGMEPIKEDALQFMRRDVWKMDETLAENCITFRAAMVLLVSEFVGPYVDRIATFAGYPLSFVELIAVRLQDAKIWEGDQVCCENWFEPNTGGMAFMLDVMVAEGKLIRAWSEERGQYAYREPDVRSFSRFAIQ